MSANLTVSEKRMISALDRIEASLNHAVQERRKGGQPVAEGSGPDLEAAQIEIARLKSENATLRERLADSHAKLLEAGEQAARLAMSNDALADANRTLLSRDGEGASVDDTGRALQAEVESLRAARSAEIGQIGEIIDALDRMLGTAAPANQPIRKSEPAVKEGGL